jgi:hypothetical protein
MATPPSIRLLKLLKDGPREGMRLSELLLFLCVAGRGIQSATVMILLDMRRKGRVGYRAPRKGASQRGGVYIISKKGKAYLARKLQAHPEWAEEVGEGEIETGVMRGEHPTILVRAAQDCRESVPVSGPTWIFDLAMRPAAVRDWPLQGRSARH